MGLDSVELIMAYEEEFGVQFDNIDAENCTTPRHVVDYIYKRVRKNKNEPCPSQVGFYKIRKILIEKFNLKRTEISPNLELSNIFGDDPREKWKLLHKSLGVEYFPPLERNSHLVLTFIFFIPISIFVFLLFNDVQLFFSVFILFVSMWFFNSITLHTAKNIPKKFNTVGSLVSFVGCANDKIWERKQILMRVIEITSEQLGIPIEEIQEDSHFIEELGID